MNATTKNNAKTINDLTAAVERCLAELRTLPRGRRYAARRAMTQRLYADLGDQIRQHWNAVQQTAEQA